MDELTRMKLQESGVASLFISILTYFVLLDAFRLDAWWAILGSFVSFVFWLAVFMKGV